MEGLGVTIACGWLCSSSRYDVFSYFVLLEGIDSTFCGANTDRGTPVRIGSAYNAVLSPVKY